MLNPGPSDMLLICVLLNVSTLFFAVWKFYILKWSNLQYPLTFLVSSLGLLYSRILKYIYPLLRCSPHAVKLTPSACTLGIGILTVWRTHHHLTQITFTTSSPAAGMARLTSSPVITLLGLDPDETGEIMGVWRPTCHTVAVCTAQHDSSSIWVVVWPLGGVWLGNSADSSLGPPEGDFKDRSTRRGTFYSTVCPAVPRLWQDVMAGPLRATWDHELSLRADSWQSSVCPAYPPGASEDMAVAPAFRPLRSGLISALNTVQPVLDLASLFAPVTGQWWQCCMLNNMRDGSVFSWAKCL